MALALDGSALGSTGSGFSFALPGLTTAQSNDVIIAFVLTNDGGVVSATSPNLTFTSRAVGGSGNNACTELYAIASGPLTNEVITIGCSTNASFITGTAFGVSGANTSTPFDVNASLPATGTTSPLTVTTTAANTMVIGAFRQLSVASPSNGAGYTLISGQNFFCTEYQIVSSAQSGLSVDESNDADVDGSIADAIQAASGGTSTTVTPAAGSVVFTGNIPTVAAGNTLLPGAGSIVFAGQAPTVAIGNTLLPGAGSVVFSGFAPAVTNGGTNAPGAGSIVFTGQAPTFTMGNVLAPGAGSVVFTGQAPTVAAGTIVLPGAGSMVFTGAAPTVTNGSGGGTTVFPGLGVMTFQGFVPGVQAFSSFHGGAPDTDQDYSWLDTGGREEENRRRLRQMREEIGLLPRKDTATAIAKAEKEVKAAVAAIVRDVPESKPDFTKIVSRYSKAYTAALLSILKDARRADIEAAFLTELRMQVPEEEKRRRRIREDDETVMALLSDLL